MEPRRQPSTARCSGTASTSGELPASVTEKLGGGEHALPNLARMYSLGLETIAGAKLLQLKFGSAAHFQPDHSVVHDDRRARFIRVQDGAALVRHPGDSDPVAVPLDALSLPPAKVERFRVRPPLKADTRPSGATLARPQPVSRAQMRWHPSRHRPSVLDP
jgi:hypothetical protein